MLVYFDPWMAGVVLPTMIIVGLIALPYIDFNQKGNGYYTFAQRKFAVTTFLFGFVVCGCVLIVLGTFLRGPNWNFFGPFEPWDPHKNVPLNNVNLSDYFWLTGLGQAVEGKGWLIRELPGIIAGAGATCCCCRRCSPRRSCAAIFIRMGFIRFFVLVTLIQFMAALPIKMVLRWTINLKYIVFIPEAFFNIMSLGVVMAATDKTYRDQYLLDIVFAVSSILMLVSLHMDVRPGLQPRIQGRAARLSRRRGRLAQRHAARADPDLERHSRMPRKAVELARTIASRNAARKQCSERDSPDADEDNARRTFKSDLKTAEARHGDQQGLSQSQGANRRPACPRRPQPSKRYQSVKADLDSITSFLRHRRR